NDRPVGNNIVDVVGGHGPGEAEIVDLDGAGSKREHAGSFCAAIAIEVDKNIYVESAHRFRQREVAVVAAVDELVECVLDPMPRGASIIRPGRYPDYLECGPVVQLEQLGG